MAAFRTLVAVAVLSCTIGAAFAQDYFVAPDGSDESPGTIDKPLKDPVLAAPRLMPGDALVFRAGEYRCKTSGTVGLAPARSGEPGKPITFRAHENEHVLIDCTGSDWGFTPNGYSHIVIDGFEITNPTHYGMKISKGAGGTRASDRVTVKNCEVHDTGSECIFAQSATNLLIDNCHLHNSKRSHGLYLQVGCHDAVVRNVTSENNYGNSGIQLNASGGGIKRALVEFCLLRNNAQGLSLMGNQNCIYRHNLLLNNGYMGPRNSGHREVIMWTHEEYGEKTICEGGLFENNTVVNLVGDKRELTHLLDLKAGTRNVVFRNNIFYVRGKPVMTIAEDSRAGLVFDHNCLFVAGYGQEVNGEGPLADFAKKFGVRAEGNIGKDPLFVDAGADDLRLKDGSPCIDAGVPDKSSVPVAGKGRDIGAFESGANIRIGCRLPWKQAD